jgi:serine/threonine-protein kinase
VTHAITWDDLELGERLGTGHSGSVFRARLRRRAYDLEAGTSVAVKTYKAWVLEEPGFIERLFREVSIGRSISNAHVLRVHGAVVSQDGRPALVMALHEGTTLELELKRRRDTNDPFSFHEAVKTLLEIALGLEALHRGGITHRDIKPANILVGASGAVIAAFGVVKSSSMPEQTTTGAFLGTIRYAAPEYLFGSHMILRVTCTPSVV